MRICIYSGGERLVAKSGVGQAIRHQREMLRRARIDTADHWCQRAGAVHINTVLPDSVLAALAAARPRGEQLFTGSLLGLKYFFASFGAQLADTRTLRGLSCPEDLLSRPDLCADLERWGRDWAVRLAEGRP